MFDDSTSSFSLNSKDKQGLLPKSREVFMDSSANNTEFSNQQNSGLLRFRSAPSSMLENFSHGVENNDGSGSRFSLGGTNGRLVSQGSLNLEDSGCDLVNGFSGLPPQYPRQNLSTQLVDDGGLLLGSNLLRQNSSPPGLFSHLTPQNGYSSILKSPLSYSSGVHSSLGMLSQITEVENESNLESGQDNDKTGNGNSDDTQQFFGSGFPFSSWSDSPNFGLKREMDNEANLNLFDAANTHVEDIGTQPQSLSQFPNTVPWKIRAKRGCATHPRSIAERVRRTRISERMRKLQDLVPNMDKQTNTADMLDFVVEYIKDLQRQYKTLTDCREICKCSAMKKPVSNQRV